LQEGAYLTGEKIVGIMSGSDLDSTGAERHVHEDGIANDGDAAADERMNKELAVQVRVARVFRVHCHGRVTEHGFETCCGHHDFIFAALNFVREFNENTEFVGAVAVARHAPALGFVELVRVDFNVRDSTLEGACTREMRIYGTGLTVSLII